MISDKTIKAIAAASDVKFLRLQLLGNGVYLLHLARHDFPQKMNSYAVARYLAPDSTISDILNIQDIED